MTARALVLSSALLTALVVSSVPTSVAQAAPSSTDDSQKKEAQALFDHAVKQSDAGDTHGALASFRAAYDKHPHFRVLYNIGKLCSRTGDAACAVRSYEQYLREGGKEVPARRRREIEAEVKALSRTLGTLSIKSTVAGALVMVDDVTIGTTPLAAPVVVNGGSHKVLLTHDGATAEKSVTVIAGESASVSFDAKDEPRPAPAAAPAAPAEAAKESAASEDAATKAEPEAGPRPFPVVPWAVTGTLAAATLVTGILASSAYGNYTDTREQFPITRDELEGAQGTARDLFLLTTLFGATTLVSLGVATWSTFFSSGANAGPPPSKARVGFAAGLGGISITGVMP